MVVNAQRMVSVDSHAVVQVLILDNVVKTVSLMIISTASALFFSGIDPCASQPCRNGGSCRPVNANSYQCICPPGYLGFDCSTRKLFMFDEIETCMRM
jgi:hypothetical protein